MSDIIYRQAAIKAIDDLPNCYNGYSDTYDKSLIIGVIEELPSAQPIDKDINVPSTDTKKGKWIPCSERLPSGYVLFCDIDGDVWYGHRMDNKWWAEGCEDKIKNVVAWMPLPEPYTADMRGEESDCDYERAVEQFEHDLLYEPTFNPNDGSM